MRRVGGVFEGGGAKGVAYAGALRAVAERGYWFSAVAGASAGALTATLIAAGMHPEQIQQASLEALGGMDPGHGKRSRGTAPRRLATALWSLSRRAYGLDETPLREWLLQTLMEQLKLFGGVAGERGPTFGELRAATMIDLYVVAANASLQEQVVFHHETTPDCQVLDAVVASCSIPGAFRPGHLAVPAPTGDLFLHTIVDGGVWANFPAYVLTDNAFRDYAGIVNTPPPEVVLGFLLDEQKPDAVLDADRYRHAQFALYDRPFALEPRFMRDFHDDAAREHPELGDLLKRDRAAMAEPAVPLEWRGELHDHHSRSFAERRKLSLDEFRAKAREDVEQSLELDDAVSSERFSLSVLAAHGSRGFWPQPNGRLARLLVRHADRQLGYLSDWRVGVVVWLSVLAGWLAISYLALAGIWELVGSEGNWALLFLLAVFVVLVTFLVAGIAVLYALLVLLGLNAIALATVRRIGYSLPRTYVAGSGAPPWLGRPGEPVIRLTIPEALTTLSFDAPHGVVAKACRLAHDATSAKLDELEARGVLTPRPRHTGGSLTGERDV